MCPVVAGIHEQARELAIGDRLQQGDQHQRPAVEAVAGIGLSDELPEAQRRRAGQGQRGVRHTEEAGIPPGITVLRGVQQTSDGQPIQR